MVAVGVTAWVPPFAGKLYELPSLPVTVSWVALVAATVNMDELPAGIEVGFAVMLTVGGVVLAATVTVVVAVAFPPAPVAVAVYVAVAVGLTTCVPPAELSEYVLLSVPVTVT